MSKTISLALSETGMAFDPSTGESYQLNETARTIIDLLQQGFTYEQIAKILPQRFDVSNEIALTDVLEFQVQMGLMGLGSSQVS